MENNEPSSSQKSRLALVKAGLIGLPVSGGTFLLWKIIQAIIALVKIFPLHASLLAWVLSGGVIVTLILLLIILWIWLWWAIRRAWYMTHPPKNEHA